MDCVECGVRGVCGGVACVVSAYGGVCEEWKCACGVYGVCEVCV